MPVVVGPVTVSGGSSYVHLFEGGYTVPAGATFMQIVVSDAGGGAFIETFFEPTGGVLAPLGPPQPLGPVNLPNHYEWSLTGPGTCFANIRNGWVTATGGYLSGAAVVSCQYGTRVKVGIPSAVLITVDLIGTIVALATAPWLLLFMLPAVGLTLDVAALCSSGQPPVPPLDPSQLTGLARTQAEAQQSLYLIQSFLWDAYCECAPAPPGQPAPTPFTPNTPPVKPDGVPDTLPPVSCDGTDICRLLNNLAFELASVGQQIQMLRRDVTVIQRYGVPFATIPGTLHPGLSGSGTIVVGLLVGLSVRTTTTPGYLSSDMAPVQSWYKLGTISFGTADGWQARHVITHNPHLFFNVGPEVNLVGYLFEPGVSAEILELWAEA